MTRSAARRLAVAALALTLAAPGAAPGSPTEASTASASVTDLPEWRRAYEFAARDIPIAEALKLFARNLRIGLEIEDGLEDRKVVDFPPDLSRRDYLDELSYEFDFLWFFDGSVLRVSPVGASETVVIALERNDAPHTLRILSNLQLIQPKFVHLSDPMSRTIRLTGPSIYIRQIEEAIAQIDKVDAKSTDVLKTGRRDTTETDIEKIGEE